MRSPARPPENVKANDPRSLWIRGPPGWRWSDRVLFTNLGRVGSRAFP